jgi:hypothetical protein
MTFSLDPKAPPLLTLTTELAIYLLDATRAILLLLLTLLAERILILAIGADSFLVWAADTHRLLLLRHQLHSLLPIGILLHNTNSLGQMTDRNVILAFALHPDDWLSDGKKNPELLWMASVINIPRLAGRIFHQTRIARTPKPRKTLICGELRADLNGRGRHLNLDLPAAAAAASQFLLGVFTVATTDAARPLLIVEDPPQKKIERPACLGWGYK